MVTNEASLQLWEKASPEILVRNYQEDNNGVWVYRLLHRYHPLIASYSLRVLKYGYEAEDIRQELFLYLSRKLKNARIHTNFTSWFMVLVRNFMVDLAKKETHRQLAQAGFQQGLGTSELPHYSTRIDSGEVMNKAEKNLSEMQFKCLKYFFVDDLSYKDIARRLNISTKQVDNALRLAKSKMTRVFQD